MKQVRTTPFRLSGNVKENGLKNGRNVMLCLSSSYKILHNTRMLH